MDSYLLRFLRLCKKGMVSLLVLAIATSNLVTGCSDDTPTKHEPTPTVLAIVDVMTLNIYEQAPTGFTGVAGHKYTEPYIPDVIGEQTLPSDVNYGIRGDTKYIWVKYEQVPADSDVPVLVDIEVAHWPSWVPICPEGWEPAGPLTTGTLTACWRNGLNVKYLPLRETDNYISMLGLSVTTSASSNSCPDSAYVCGKNWPREKCDLDIHSGCGDDLFYYVCYYRPAISRCADTR